MKTIILLTLVSLSFAFIPQGLFNRYDNSDGFLSGKDKYDSVNTTQLNSSIEESFASTNESESSDYYYTDYSLSSDESDWNSKNVTNTTHTAWAYNTTYGDFGPTNETYYENDTNFTTSNNFTEDIYGYYPSDETDPGDESLYEAISALASLFNETSEEDGRYIFVKFVGLDDLNITSEDIYEVLNSTEFKITLLSFNESLLQDNETDSSDNYYLGYGLYSDESDYNITDGTQSYEAILASALASLFNETAEEDIHYILAKLINIDDINITDQEDNYDTLNSTQFDNFNESLVQSDETDSSDGYYIGYGLYSDESDWDSNNTNLTQTENITYSTFIPLNETYSIAENDTTVESFRSKFENFTEAMAEYLLNNIENNLEEDKLYDEVLSSIALLFNQTIEERALFGFEQGEDN